MVEPDSRYITNWRVAEENAAAWMVHWGFLNVRLTGAGADQGIDVRADFAIAQVKFGPTRVGRPALQRLVGARAGDDELQMIFFSGAGYSPQAVAYARTMGIGLFTYEDEGAMQVVNGIPGGPKVGPTKRQSHAKRLLDAQQAELTAAQQLDRRNSEWARTRRMNQTLSAAREGRLLDDAGAVSSGREDRAFPAALKAQLESAHRWAQAREALRRPGLTAAERVERGRQIDEEELSEAGQRLSSLMEAIRLSEAREAAAAVRELEELSRERAASEAAAQARSAAVDEAKERFDRAEESLSRRAHEIRRKSFKSRLWKTQKLIELQSEWDAEERKYASVVGRGRPRPTWIAPV